MVRPAKNSKSSTVATKTNKARAVTQAIIFPTAPKAFADKLYSNVLAADIALLSNKDRASITNSLWAFIQGRKVEYL